MFVTFFLKARLISSTDTWIICYDTISCLYSVLHGNNVNTYCFSLPKASYIRIPNYLSVDTFYRSFSLTRNKKINWKSYSGRSQAEMKCYKRLICPSLRSLWPSFWAICRNVSRTFEELCMVGRHIGIQFWWTNMAAGNQQKHLEFTFPITALSFHSRTLTCAHKHIF